MIITQLTKDSICAQDINTKIIHEISPQSKENKKVQLKYTKYNIIQANALTIHKM